MSIKIKVTPDMEAFKGVFERIERIEETVRDMETMLDRAFDVILCNSDPQDFRASAWLDEYLAKYNKDSDR